jgi:hypothetical protein
MSVSLSLSRPYFRSSSAYSKSPLFSSILLLLLLPVLYFRKKKEEEEKEKKMRTFNLFAALWLDKVDYRKRITTTAMLA